jgi:putative ABC transport system permease protein
VIFDFDSWQEIWASISRNRLRTILTAFGVFWGIFMLMLLIGSGNGLENGVTAGFSRFATNSFFVWGRRTGKPYRGLSPGRDITMDNQDTAAISKVPGVEIVAPRNQLGGHRGGNNVTRGVNSGAFSVMGDYPAVWKMQPLELADGRFLNPLDLDQRRKVAVIGTRVRDVLFDRDENPLEKHIRINGVYFKVIGVFKSLNQGERADRDAETVFIPFTTFQQAFNYGDRVGWYMIKVRDDASAKDAEEAVLTMLRERHRVAPDDSRAFGSFNLADEFHKIQNLFLGIRILVWIVGIGTLAAGVIGVSNIMLIIVRERTSEIGLRRAIGATPIRIISQVVLESVALTASAGYFGLLAGVAVIELIRTTLAHAPSTGRQMFVNPGVGFDSAVQCLIILVASGVLAGLLPARRAISISPREALRTE